MISSSGVPAMRGRFIVLVDGENLVFRAQEMMKSGRKLIDAAAHFPNTFLWHQSILQLYNWQCIRASYYTSAVGADNDIADLEERISKVLVARIGDAATQMCPRVFKKDANSRKAKLVDISITID